ncbi:MAG: hypothetical protein ACXAEN_26730 [Candidatus Thorarchaeota archaeon]|jgi:hypothetical protein
MVDKLTQFYLDNGWFDPVIAEIVGRIEDGEDVAPDELAPIDDKIKLLLGTLKELIESTNAVLDGTSTSDLAERMFRVTTAVVNARQALAAMQQEVNDDH